MRLVHKLVLILLVAFLPAAACTSAPGARQFADKTWTGVVRSRIAPPEGSGLRGQGHHGRSTAELQMTGRDSARFILIGNIREENDASFGAEGRFVGQEWRADTEIPVVISADGKISGQGVLHGNRMMMDGQFTGDDLKVLVEIEPMTTTAGGYPVGTRFSFLYELRHFRERKAGSGPADGKCREIVYRLKLVPNPFGGTMGMVRVPECRR